MSEESTPEGTLDDAASKILQIMQRDSEEQPEAEPEETEELEAEEVDEESYSSDEEDFTEDEPEGEYEEESEESAEDEPEPTYTVKINGEEVEVTLEEALSGYMKEQDYRNKTAEVSKTRKELEAEREKILDLQAKRQDLVKELEILSELNNRPLFTEQQLDEILDKEGEKAYLKAKASNERHEKTKSAVRQRLEQVSNELSEDQKAEYQKLVAKEQAALLTALPEIQNPDNARKLASYLLGQGFEQDQIDSTVDHRMFILAEKARRYDEMQGKVKKKATPPKIGKTKGSRKDNSFVQAKALDDARKRLRTTGSAEDAAELIKLRQRKN